MNIYQLHNALLLRTPYYSYRDYRPGELARIITDPQFRRAIYFANPEFYDLLERQNFDYRALKEKEISSLRSYYNRMSFRPTPFGCFSCFSLTAWGDHGPLILSGHQQVKIHLLPDHELALQLAGLIEPHGPSGPLRLNSTLYRFGQGYRFIKTSAGSQKSRLEFSLESAASSPLLHQLVRKLQNHNCSFARLSDYIAGKTGCGIAAAADYIRLLEAAQLIIRQDGVNITGADYFSRQAQPFDGAGPGTLFGWELDPLTTPPGAFRKTEQALQQRFAAANLHFPKRIYYCNTERPVAGGAIDNLHRAELSAALGCLQQLAVPARATALERFAAEFTKRFEGRKVNLLQALDPDAGIGYGRFARAAGSQNLLKDLNFNPDSRQDPMVNWTANHRYLFKLWSSQKHKTDVLRIDESQLTAVDSAAVTSFPNTTAVMFRILADHILIESAGGASAQVLIGRFTKFSGKVEALAKELAGVEIGANPAVLFAEIIQLSDGHTDNINRRAQIYDYEIPVNAVSLLPADRQIRPADLLVSVENGEILLESPKHGKRVVPRLSSAYNPRNNHLALFRFLYDLQYQRLQTDLGFDLESYFPGMAFYPRVVFGHSILSLAKWQLTTKELKGLKVSDRGQAIQWLEALRQRLCLPSQMSLARGDNQLVFDLAREGDALHLIACVKNLESCTLQEYLPPGDHEAAVRDPDGKSYNHQLVAFAFHDQELFKGPAVTEKPKSSRIRKDFIVGSSWLYFKIYCTPVSANTILTVQVRQVIAAIKRRFALNWFFIRYQDPDTHLRLRINVAEQHLGEVIQLMKTGFAKLVDSSLVRDYQADTYRRELHRYGDDLMLPAEQFFRASSEWVISYIKSSDDAPGKNEYRFTITGIRLMLETMLPEIPQQLKFLNAVSAAFLREFKADKPMIIALDQLYRDLKPDFETKGDYPMVPLASSTGSREFIAVFRVIAEKAKRLSDKRRQALLGDLIHMHINRIFPAEQRKHEMVLYYCFVKAKTSAWIRLQQKPS